MKKNIMILLVFASLTCQSTYVSTLMVDYGLSEKQAGALQRIMVSQEATLTIFLTASTILFDTIFDLKVENDDLHYKITESIIRVKAGMDVCLNSDLLVFGKSCFAVVEVAREATHANFDDAFARIAASLNLAGFENHSKTRATIGTQHAAAYKDYEDLVKIEHGVINTCLNTTNADTLNVIENTRIGLYVSVTNVINAAFNAIKVYAFAGPRKCGDVTFTLDIKNLRDKIFASIKTYVQYKFSLLRTLYINSCLNQYGIVYGVAESQYTDVASFFQFMDGNKNIFGVATSYLKRIDLGLYDDDNGKAFSATNVSFAKVIATNDAGDGIILNFISFIHPNASSRIATAKEYLHALNVKANTATFDAFDVAVARDKTHSEIVGSIETLRKSVVSIVSDYVQYIFRLIRNNRTFDRKTEDELESLENVAFYGGKMKTLKIFDAALILAKASHAGVVDEENYSAIEVLRDEVNQALNVLTQGVTAAGLFVFRAMNAS